jgi:hypothetical protein
VLARQKELAAAGQRKLFGALVVEMGLAPADAVQRAVDRQQLERT